MRVGWLMLVSLLGGCQADADTLEQAVSASLAKLDYRLIVRAGRGEVVPGIAPEQQASAKSRCGVRYLDGLGDVIKPGQRPRPSWRPMRPITTGACWCIVLLSPTSNKSARGHGIPRGEA